ncbi:TonB-dependent receptor [Aurantibacillus circumpalustris]|uniref:TonB-dependent receptor n=1 Tax=Aurantibacillus circumpalustris TaxID=3036359 RepID=UPI00295AF552|nr:TonB-dependent receptor [Aurantibacillus circumpalustris]
MKKIYLAVVLVIFASLSALAQNDNGAIKITLKDKSTGEAIPFANVVAYKDGVQVGVATTNMDGEAFIKPLTPGKYTVKGIYIGYQAAEVKDVVVGEGKTSYVPINLANGEGVNLETIDVIAYQVPLIDPDTKSGATVTREDYQNLATKDINSVAATTAGVYQADEGSKINIRGGRDNNATYFVDGVKVFGTPRLPQQSIEQLQVITGGVPASYGDLTSGAISISTRGPQSKYFGGVELISSQLTDKFGYNSIGFSLGGPLYKKRDSTRRTVLGFFVSGQGNYIKEPSPSFVPIYVLKDEKLQQVKENPLTPSRSGTGYVRSSEFVTKDDMTTQRFRPNAVFRSLSLNGKLDYQPTNNTNVTLGGFYEYSDQFNATNTNPAVASNAMFNSNNNSQTINTTWRTNLSITQKFGNATADKTKTQSLLSNSYFKFLASYEKVIATTQSAQHKDNVFDYGYIGNFEIPRSTYMNAYNYDFTPDYQPTSGSLATPSYTYLGDRTGGVKFTPGTQNPDAALYTSWLAAHTATRLFTMDYIAANNGLRNGDQPATIYNLFNSFGFGNSVYRKQTDEQIRITASFNTDIKNHALTFGLEFDQRSLSYFGLNATALWTRMRQITNQHTAQLDKSNPHLNTELSGVIPYYYYDYLYQENQQTQFSEKLLEKLNLPKNHTGFVNTDAIDPSILSLDMFSAEDLLGTTDNANLISYYGYSHDGKKTGGKTNINDFLEKKDDSGRNTLPIGAFRPIYSSVYIMDKFDFKDIKFLAGFRVDRYDANQQVLKDKYSLHELAKVSDLGSLENLPAGFTDNIPGNISKDAAVYVAQNPQGGKSPLAILGYREGDKWFNSEGNEISDPNLISTSDGRPIPLYKDMANYDKKMSIGAFENYIAAINPQPRLGFSFPISDVANFFAHYDWLIQRPTNNQLNPLDYYFLNASQQNPLIQNPNLKPQQTIDYELGFAQVLNERKNAALTITSFYKEFRNQINQRVVVGAYPKNYIMYDNIDFSTVKGLSLKFELRRTGGSQINFNYTLQFAEGSGSNINSGANLASSGQPNLRVLQPLDYDQRHSFVLSYDYRFGSKKDYKGPTFKTKKNKTIQFLEDVGFNFTFLLGSGTPYTRWNTAVPINGGGRSSIVGQINGSSKPWQFRANLRIDKNIALEWGKNESDNKKTANLNIYLQILNLFNTSNVINVYHYTGASDDDGYLQSTQGQNALSITNSAAAFSDMYSIRMNAPNNYSLPRQIRIGVLFEF